jgi:hypothetical protein
MNERKLRVNVPVEVQQQETPWKFREAKDARGRIFKMFVSARDRIKPSKYQPKFGKALRNSPYCLDMGRTDVYHCRSCMWRFTCKAYG